MTDSTKTKVEEDIERHVLSTTVKLSDGTLGQVFSRGGRNEFQVFLYNCHVCGVPNLPGERCLQTHISGRKHQMRLSQGVIDAVAFRAPMQTKSKIQMNIAPGEPVPPGFENEVKRIAEIQPVLDKNKEDSYIGLEYIVELTGGPEASYHCILCDKRGDPRTILAHAVSYNHRLKYLDKHYPSCMRELSEFKGQKEARAVLPKVIQTVCAAIEEVHGRLTMAVHDREDYEKNKMKYLTEIINEKHFDEKTGPKFIKVIDRAKINEMIRRSKISSNLRKRNSSPDVDPRMKVDHTRADRKSLDSISDISDTSMRSRSRSPRSKRQRRRRSPSLSLSPEPSRRPVKPKKTLPTPEELTLQANAILEDRYKWEKFRCLVEKAVEELNKVQKEHEKNPEKHPLYPEEWKRFWNRRYKELQQEKKDPAKHDFKPEWIKFWTHRMKELHEEEIDRRKKEIREKVGLPLEEEKKESVEIIKISDSPDSLVGSRKRNSLSPWSDEGGRRIRPSPKRGRPRSRSRSPSRRRSRSRSPRSSRSRLSRSPGRRSFSPGRRDRDRYYERPVRYVAPPPPDPYYNFEEWASYYGPHKTRPTFASRAPPAAGYSSRPVEPPEPEEPESDEPLTVVSVLRLLTALEEHLGSLGPKCIDLLAKALALEKVKANSADELLVNEDTCVFFETTKEKLKGQILAGVMEPGKVKAVKKAVKNIAGIIHMVTKKREEKENGEAKDDTKEAEKKVEVKLGSKPAGSGLDRGKISLKLSAELSNQGRDDISQSDLEQLVLVFMGMLQRSKQTSEIVTVKDFLAENDVRTVEGGEKTMVDIKKTIEDDFKEDIANNSDANALESLTDSDLQTLLQNFKDLSPEEQHHLISYLKKLEATDPTRVEKLRKFVNLDATSAEKRRELERPTISEDRHHEASTDNTQKVVEKKQSAIYDSDDDDDDYNFDDVVKAASKNVKEKQMQDHMKVVQESLQHQQKSVISLDDDDIEPQAASPAKKNPPAAPSLAGMSYPADTQTLIANIMGSLQKNVSRTGQPEKETTVESSTSLSNLNSLPYYQQTNTYVPNPYAVQTTQAANNFYPNYVMPNNIPGMFPAATATTMTSSAQSMYPAVTQQQQQQTQQQSNPWANQAYGKYY
ncbi:uncharacterized protein CG7065 isoform X1 [Lutzomyia longipalpis]|uniref:uncharacterized protein CG7065 isoform X1 n=2 Tax=Lutzomyia longipalpis TaxID=7200 RepID=UPI0024836DC7|nr:uncharacterized protein CG7065 isoform X1 [Lutzomyia longipalpis]